MFRSKVNKIISVTSLFSTATDYDIVSNDTKTAQEIAISKAHETGWDRLKQLFVYDEFGRLSPEVQNTLTVIFMSTVTGLLYGGVINAREAYLDFIKNNEATSFANHYVAKRKLQDYVTIRFAKGGYKWSWRLTAFTTSYMCTSTCISAYRGKHGLIEHSVAGVVAGTLYKFKFGPQGWIVGGVLGGILGTLAGITSWALLHAFDMSMDDVKYWNQKWLNRRSDALNEAIKQKLKEDELQIFKDHELRHQNIKTLNNLDNTVNK